MKLSTFILSAVSAARVKRNPADDGWTLIPASHGISEGTHYKVNGSGTADEALAYCAEQGGFLPMSTNSSHMYTYRQLGASAGGYYWPGFRKTAGIWNADPWSGDASDGGTDQPSQDEACGMAYADQSGNAYVYQLPCSSSGGGIICLKDANAESAGPAEINNIVDAWNDMVNFPNAETHGCQCLNLLSDADTRYPGKPRDELDRVCLDWQNAIKCQRFEGGICGPRKEDELPSYTNYANCTLNNDPCAAALCEINRKFANDVNNLSNTITPTAVVNPEANCTRTKDAPNYDSCCFTDIFSSIRYNSAYKGCVNGEVVCPAGTAGATCEQCPAGTYAPAGASSCTACGTNDQGQQLYSAAGATECVPCTAPTDMVIQLDGSGSLDQTFWNEEINFVKGFVNNFDVSPDNTRISVTQYNSGVTTHIDEFNLRDQTAVNSAFNSIPFQRIGCNTCSRIGTGYKVANEIFRDHARPASKKVLVAFTDGFTLGAGVSDLAPAMRNLENQGVKVFLILVHSSGVSALSGYNMNHFTTNAATNGFITNNWNNLDAVAEAVQNSVCA